MGGPCRERAPAHVPPMAQVAVTEGTRSGLRQQKKPPNNVGVNRSYSSFIANHFGL